MNRRKGEMVVLNVYDLTEMNSYGSSFGLGAFHSGVVVYGREYSFGSHDFEATGVFYTSPREVPNCRFRESVELGMTNLTTSEVATVIQRLSPLFPGNGYNLLSRNCNHFSDELAVQLCGAHIPNWVNRLAYWGSWVPCCIPGATRAPVSGSPSSSSSSGGAAVPTFTAFEGTGQVLSSGPSSSALDPGADAASQRHLRALAAEAALARMQAQQLASSGSGTVAGEAGEVGM